jgi:hypothetical protein
MTNPTQRHHVHWWEVVVSYPCPLPDCGAGPGERCLTSSGRVKWEPHAARSRVASAHHWRDAEEDDQELTEPDDPA